tara:strand:+ start:810 stop:1064 length:255 start_codon:yes stop_codon:yes gene_type:complete
MFTSLFTENLSLDNATRLWDVMVFEGDAVLVRAAVAYMVELEGKLFGVKTEGEVRAVVERGLGSGSLVGNEDAWMGAVRGAGKA